MSAFIMWMARINSRTIFLLDGLGAFLSALMLAVILPMFFETLGIPKDILLKLAFIPLIYCLYSLCVFRFFANPKSVWLKVVITANLIYCLISLGLLFYLPQLTRWGCAYLLAEILILLALVRLEVLVYRRSFS